MKSILLRTMVGKFPNVGDVHTVKTVLNFYQIRPRGVFTLAGQIGILGALGFLFFGGERKK